MYICLICYSIILSTFNPTWFYYTIYEKNVLLITFDLITVIKLYYHIMLIFVDILYGVL